MGARCGRGQLKLAGSCLLLAPDGSFVHTDDPDNHDPTCSTPPPPGPRRVRTETRPHPPERRRAPYTCLQARRNGSRDGPVQPGTKARAGPRGRECWAASRLSPAPLLATPAP